MDGRRAQQLAPVPQTMLVTPELGQLSQQQGVSVACACVVLTVKPGTPPVQVLVVTVQVTPFETDMPGRPAQLDE